MIATDMFGLKSQAFWHKRHSSTLTIGIDYLFYMMGDRNLTAASIFWEIISHTHMHTYRNPYKYICIYLCICTYSSCSIKIMFLFSIYDFPGFQAESGWSLLYWDHKQPCTQCREIYLQQMHCIHSASLIK